MIWRTCLFLFLGALATPAAHEPAPDFAELRALLRANLPGATEADLDRAAANGFFQTFTNEIRWESTPAAPPTNPVPLLTKSIVLEKDIALLRVGHVADGLAAALATAEKNLTASNKLAGVVVDLRFADGQAFTAAESAAVFPSTTPLVVLINSHTCGAAVALAAGLRARRALLLGAHTASDDSAWRTFTLRDGRRLQLATATPSASGLEPDIAVNISEADEKTLFADAYAAVVKPTTLVTETNRPPRRVSEADLVRARREGAADPEEELAAEPTIVPITRTLRDPALARAVDLLHSLALLGSQKN